MLFLTTISASNSFSSDCISKLAAKTEIEKDKHTTYCCELKKDSNTNLSMSCLYDL